MENLEERKQNNRKEDIKRNPDSDKNAPSKDKEWDPDRDKAQDITEEEKLKNLKGVRKPKKSNQNEK
ncbi:hypothetical protein [Gelidibacter sp.]|uniref:hypothetical protein n=1 Tax=Gelidibacter sp. TaxID=2018083 RepID=UPI002CF832AF|nr:hypothetical protein [Gelidibacter sp.]HUH28899.1 hypothetical protein [Gelidibacter sp.]